MNEQVEKKVLTIERSLWVRGGGRTRYLYGDAALLNEKGRMCCLGFDALACGLQQEDILHVEMPADIISKVVTKEYYETRMNVYTNSAVCRAQILNDDRNITDEEREAQLIPVLKELGWDEVVFID